MRNDVFSVLYEKAANNHSTDIPPDPMEKRHTSVPARYRHKLVADSQPSLSTEESWKQQYFGVPDRIVNELD